MRGAAGVGVGNELRDRLRRQRDPVRPVPAGRAVRRGRRARPVRRRVWFASVLRDGFALSVAGTGRTSRAVARETLTGAAVRVLAGPAARGRCRARARGPDRAAGAPRRRPRCPGARRGGLPDGDAEQRRHRRSRSSCSGTPASWTTSSGCCPWTRPGVEALARGLPVRRCGVRRPPGGDGAGGHPSLGRRRRDPGRARRRVGRPARGPLPAGPSARRRTPSPGSTGLLRRAGLTSFRTSRPGSPCPRC